MAQSQDVEKMSLDIYDYNRVAIDRILANQRTNRSTGKKILLGDKQLDTMRRFHEWLTLKGYPVTTRHTYVTTIAAVAEHTAKPLEELVAEDLIEEARRYAKSTARVRLANLKIFLRWLGREAVVEDLNAKLSEQNGISRGPREEIEAFDMDNTLSAADVSRMMDVCRNAMHRCLIAFLDATGGRIGEVARVNLGDIKWFGADDERYAKVTLRGKTGKRRIPLTEREFPEFFASLTDWLKLHPDNQNPRARLWSYVSNTGEIVPHSYSGLNGCVRRIAQRAGIAKPRTDNQEPGLGPHELRHRRLTIWARQFPTQQLKYLGGWGRMSSMPSHYSHENEQTVTDAMLSRAGFKEVEGVEEIPLRSLGIVPQEADPQVKDEIAELRAQVSALVKMQSLQVLRNFYVNGSGLSESETNILIGGPITREELGALRKLVREIGAAQEHRKP